MRGNYQRSQKYIVVHSGNRDYYQVAYSLYEEDKLRCIVTDDYFLRKDKVFKKKSLIAISINALILHICVRYFKKHLEYCFKNLNLNMLKDDYLSRYTEKISNKYPFDTVLAYSGYTSALFSRVCNVVVFQFHPHHQSVYKLIKEEININPNTSKSLSQENEINIDSSLKTILSKEIEFAKHFICASQYTASTLIEQGVCQDRITVIPYGVNLTRFPEKHKYFRQKETLNIIYVGSLNARKGVHYLFQAFQIMRKNKYNVNLTIVGRGIFDIELVDASIEGVNILNNISNDDLLYQYHNADVFVMPSLCEGFGHVILEAMATGLPVITTTNTCGPDVISEGVDGYIIPIRSVDILVQRLVGLFDDPQFNIQMGRNASKKAQNYTWKKFRENVSTLLNDIELK